jgi:hypothetical protein
LNLGSIKVEEGLDLDDLAAKIEGYSGADITNVLSLLISHILIGIDLQRRQHDEHAKKN